MKILSLDLSTSCTGWATFDVETNHMLLCGRIKSSTAGTSKLGKLNKTHHKMLGVINEILHLIQKELPDVLVIEEIAGSRSRLTQKTLDGFHWLLLHMVGDYWRDRVFFYDVTGADGWRTHLGLKLDDADKAANKEAKKLNKSLKGSQKLPIIGPKHLSCRYANSLYDNLNLDVDENTTDGDVADAICMGDAWIRFHHNKETINGKV